MASSSKKNTSPLTALAPLHALAQLVPDASPDARSTSGSKPEDKREQGRAYILLTNLEPDACVIHIGHPDGRWWNGTWRVADVETLASGDMSSARLGAFAQRIARTIVQREVAIAHEGEDFHNMRLVLGTQAKKPLHLALSELDRDNAARFAFEYFARIAEDAQAHDCRILHGYGGSTDAGTDSQPQGVPYPPLKRRRTQSSINSPLPSRGTSPMSQQSYDIRTAHSHDGDDTDPPGRSRGLAQRLPDRDPGKRKPPSTQGKTPTERAALAEVQELRAELAKARADAAAAVARASKHEPSGLGGSVDRLRSRAAVPVMPRRPGASLANPNKAARRVTAVEFASDSDDA